MYFYESVYIIFPSRPHNVHVDMEFRPLTPSCINTYNVYILNLFTVFFLSTFVNTVNDNYYLNIMYCNFINFLYSLISNVTDRLFVVYHLCLCNE